jgi:hypothetical protein
MTEQPRHVHELLPMRLDFGILLSDNTRRKCSCLSLHVDTGLLVTHASPPPINRLLLAGVGVGVI